MHCDRPSSSSPKLGLCYLEPFLTAVQQLQTRNTEPWSIKTIRRSSFLIWLMSINSPIMIVDFDHVVGNNTLAVHLNAYWIALIVLVAQQIVKPYCLRQHEPTSLHANLQISGRYRKKTWDANGLQIPYWLQAYSLPDYEFYTQPSKLRMLIGQAARNASIGFNYLTPVHDPRLDSRLVDRAHRTLVGLDPEVVLADYTSTSKLRIAWNVG